MSKPSIKVLEECAALQLKKSNDYQNPNSTIRQADYYPRGVASILDIIHTKTLRMRSVLEAMESDPSYTPNFESLEDSGKDLINYASFFVAYLRGGVDGQCRALLQLADALEHGKRGRHHGVHARPAPARDLAGLPSRVAG